MTPTLIELLMCFHCGNVVPHQQIGHYHGEQLYEYIDGERYSEDYEYVLYQCPTCHGVSIYGDFVLYPRYEKITEKRLYPRGSRFLPEEHKLVDKNCVPQQIVKLYEQIWPLRYVSPTIFAGQMRRILELICHDQKAQGKSLFLSLQDLATRGILPKPYAEATDLLRTIGNMGAHSGTDDVDFWDAELLDDFFRWTIEFLYVAPAEIERLKQRIQGRKDHEGLDGWGNPIVSTP